MLYITGKDESDFARPVGVPKGSKRFGNTGSAGMTGTLGRKAMGSKPSGKLTCDVLLIKETLLW